MTRRFAGLTSLALPIIIAASSHATEIEDVSNVEFDDTPKAVADGGQGSQDPITEMVTTIASSARVPPRLVIAIIIAESRGNPKALSPKGAMGLMQLMPDTAKRFGVDDPYDPESNIYGGTQYLRELLDRFNGNITFAVCAYNAGEHRIDEYNGCPPFEETRKYMNQVLAFVHQL